MNLITQLKTINSSAVALTVAQAYLAGAVVPLVTMVLPHFATTDYVAAWLFFWKECLCNPAWLYLFFKASLNSGIAFTIGALMKTNAFDHFKTYFVPQNNVPPPPPPTVKNITIDQSGNISLDPKNPIDHK